ncbi:MFS transporter [Bombilactobacillus thymidiniphilus]|uniref:MFS transporter n=1 Tax=Bombilactobacillus thymidiniphilus TaxID=2923363 RepID=A0ABY4PC32_9LACO|nr:MFS transporter [Bombilactobacillus thymidiniphilus]UQS83204.1 MFS transporter [Bombilactobacillus thymidiniphilus]
MKKLHLKPLLIVAFLNETAYSMMWPLATIYIHDILHKSLTIAGIALLLFSTANVIGAVVAGKLYDRWNQFWLTIGAMIGCIIVCILGAFFVDWPGYALVLTGFGFVTGWLTTAVNVYGTLMSGRSTTKIFNELYLVLNLGLVIGTMAISEIFKNSVVPIFILVTIIYIVSLVVLLFYFPQQRLEYTSFQADKKVASQPTKRLDSRILAVSFLSLVIMWMMYTQWESNFSIYLLDNGFKLRFYSLLWALNGVVIIIVQLLLARWPQLISKLKNRIIVGLLFLAISYFVTLATNSVLLICVGMILLTIGEAFYVPTVPALINAGTPVEQKGHRQGLVNGFSSIGRAIGPMFGGLIVDHASFKVLFIVAGFALLAITLLNYWASKGIQE